MNRKNKKELCDKIESNKISTLIQRDEILSDDLEIKVECTLIRKSSPAFAIIHFKNRMFAIYFCSSIWGNKQAILEMAKEIVKFLDLTQPFTE